MKIIFIIEYRNNYKHFSPLIQEGLRRGHAIECWHHNISYNLGVKKYLFADLKDIPSFDDFNKPVGRTFRTKEELLEKLLAPENKIDLVVSIHPPSRFWQEKQCLKLPFLWAVLMVPADSFLTMARDGYSFPKSKVFFAIHNQKWLEMGMEYFARYFPGHEKMFGGSNITCASIGIPEFDLFKGIDKEFVRKKYGIPAGKDILLYLPFAFCQRSHSSAWELMFSGLHTNTHLSAEGAFNHKRKLPIRKKLLQDASYLRGIIRDKYARECLFKGLNEARVFRSIGKFCGRNHLYLVAKPRLKFQVAEVVKQKADLTVWDDEKQFTPPILKELLSIAKLTVSYFSYSVLSSIFAGVPHLNIEVPDVCFSNSPTKYFFQGKAPSVFNFPGVCESWSIEEVIDNLKNQNIDRFAIDLEKRNEYIEQYIGYDDYHSSRRFFDGLERVCDVK